MADWTDIDVNSLLPGQPFTSSIALAYEENPRALAEQAAGAPKIADKTVSGTGTVTISALDDFGGVWFRGQFVGSDTSTLTKVVSVQYSTDDGSSFSSSTTVSSITLATSPGNTINFIVSVEGFIDFASGSLKAVSTAFGDLGTSDTDSRNSTISGMDENVTDIRILGLSTLFATPQGGESA